MRYTATISQQDGKQQEQSGDDLGSLKAWLLENIEQSEHDDGIELWSITDNHKDGAIVCASGTIKEIK